MPYLIAAVVLLAVLCGLNLSLTYGVIRRLRVHNELLAQGPAGVPNPLAAAGSTVGAFTATTLDGAELVADDLTAGTLVGFFSPDCRACAELLPTFVEVAAAHPGGPAQVLAVVIGSAEEAAEQAVALSSRARVVVASPGAEIEKAFAVRGYPGFALLGENRIVTASGMMSMVAGAAARAVA